MKTIRTVAILAFCMGLLCCTTSCAVAVKKDFGFQKEGNKNQNNTNNPISTSPGPGVH